MPRPTRRLLGIGSAALVLTLATGALAGPAAAGAAPPGHGNPEYMITFRGAALEGYPGSTQKYKAGGYSLVELVKSAGQAAPGCRAEGAGYVLDEGENPTLSRQSVPASAAAHLKDQAPTFPAEGSGAQWKGTCTPDGLSGTGIGDDMNAQGLRLGSSTVSGAIDPESGVYTGTGTATISGFDLAEATGVEVKFDSISSQMHVTKTGNAEPVVSYRLSILNSDPAQTTLGGKGFTLYGNDIPADMLVTTFNKQVADSAQQIESFASGGLDLGLRILAPQVTKDEATGLTTIVAPAVAGEFGLLFQTFGARLGSLTFTG